MPSSPLNKRIVVAVSGGGRSLTNLLKHQDEFEVVGVVSSSASCKAVSLAKEADLPVHIQDFKHASAKELYDFINALDASLIVLAGFLKPFPLDPAFQNRIINIHPALLPAYGGKGMYGMNVHKAVAEACEKKSGATVHFVNERYDEGQIISQIEVLLPPEPTPESIAGKVFEAECELLPLTVKNLLKGDWPLAGNAIARLTHDS